MAKPSKPAPAPDPAPAQSPSEYEEVLDLVQRNPRAWLGCGELATLFRIPAPYITAASKAKDTPFIGKSCHPDELDKWLRNHPGMTV